jgi:hypothetical protein
MRDDELDAMLAAYRRHTSLSPAREDRILVRLRHSVREAPVEASRSERRRADVPVRWIALGLAVAAALAVLWLEPALVGVEQRHADPDAASRVVADSDAREHVEGGVRKLGDATTSQALGVAPIEDAIEDAGQPAGEDAGDGGRDTEVERVRASERVAPKGVTRSRDRGAATSDDRPDTPAEALAAEAALLRRANARLSSGDAQRALIVLQDWEARFPHGSLHEEHAALRAIALCALGRLIQGRGEAKAFARRYVGSAHIERVRSACSEGGEKKPTDPNRPGQ